MTSTLKLSAILVSAFALSQVSFAAPVNSCANVGQPVNGVASIACTFAYNGTPSTLSLLPYQTQNGSSVDFNDLGAGYVVLINGNPSTLADNTTGLFNTSLWESVLYFADDEPGDSSDSVQAFFAGSPFPPAATVKSVDEGLYGGFGTPDSAFFEQATGAITTFTLANTTFTITPAPPAAATPEPNSLILMLSGVLGLGLFAGRKQLQGHFARSI
jgi:hypothetical protein